MATFRAKKRFGQHFLTSPDVVARIIDCLSASTEDTIIEIGPGRGALTTPLAATGATVIAVELERDAAAFLSASFNKHPHVQIVNEDFLKFDPSIVAGKRFKLVGNLPYNITTPVIDWAIRYRARIQSACFMVQRELAARLAASPGSKDWSPLSIFTQLHFEVVRRFEVGPEHFEPPPEVMSAIVTLKPTTAPTIANQDLFEKTVRASFRHRRKLLTNNLIPEIVPDTAAAQALLDTLNLPHSVRAEQVSIDQFLRLTELLAELRMK